LDFAVWVAVLTAGFFPKCAALANPLTSGFDAQHSGAAGPKGDAAWRSLKSAHRQPDMVVHYRTFIR